MPTWKLLRSETVISSTWLTLSRNSYETPSGNPVHEYYVLERRPFVLVVAALQRSLVMITQYRVATDKTYLAFPGGYLEPGEEPLTAAARELREETGLEGDDFRYLGVLDPLPGYIRSAAHVVACVVSRSPAPEFVSDGDEAAVPQLIPMDEIERRIVENSVQEMQTVAAFCLYDRGMRDPKNGDRRR